jgi:hypothetical protein
MKSFLSLVERGMKFQDDKNHDRIHLGFTSEVLSFFHFLIKDYDFKYIKIESTFVRYESNFIFVNVYHGASSYELGVEIGKLENYLPIREDWYSIGEIMDLMGVRKNLGFTFFQASSKEQVHILVRQLAAYVKKYAKPILDGHYEIFDKLEILRKNKSDAYIREAELRNIRERADIAWKQKDYAKFIELYNQVKDGLTSIEGKNLDYARKKLGAE